jgi:hypothetical protein
MARAAAVTFLCAFLIYGAACDPVTGTGPGDQPDPKNFMHVDASTRTAVVTLIAGYPATDYAFNYDGYGSGSLVITVPVGWQVTVQCENRSTIPNSCAIVSGKGDVEPLEPGWSTPDPVHGLGPGKSATFEFTPTKAGSFRIASLVVGSEASGMWADLEVSAGGQPGISGS